MLENFLIRDGRTDIEGQQMSAIDLGSIQASFVDPHRGFEVSYNRNYERFTCLAMVHVGPECYASGRFVARAQEKATRRLRGIDLDKLEGTLLNVYWMEGDGSKQDEWSAVNTPRLGALGKRNFNRELLASFNCRSVWSYRRSENGVPAQLALEHHYPGFAMALSVPADGHSTQDLSQAYFADGAPQIMSKVGELATCVGSIPYHTRADNRPGLPQGEANPVKLVQLHHLVTFYFLEAPPDVCFDALMDAHEGWLDESGVGAPVWASSFVPTVPGTDTYMDAETLGLP